MIRLVEVVPNANGRHFATWKRNHLGPIAHTSKGWLLDGCHFFSLWHVILQFHLRYVLTTQFDRYSRIIFRMVGSTSRFKNCFWLVVSNIFYVHPYLGKIPILTNIFSIGLKPPTRFNFSTVVPLHQTIVYHLPLRTSEEAGPRRDVRS